MKIWILALIAIVLLVVSLWSERFEATPSIRSTYDAEEKIRIFGMATPTDQSVLRAKVNAQSITETEPAAREKKMKELAGALLTPALGDFFTQVFRPATVPVTQAQVNSFVDARPPSDIKDIEKKVLKTYFVDQQGVGTAQASGYASVLAGLGQNVGYLKPSTGGTGATGPVGQGPTGPVGAVQMGPTGPMGPGSIPSMGPTGPTGQSSVSPTGPGAVQGTPTTTGGSASGAGVTVTPSSSNGLFGPASMGMGDPSPVGKSPDSSKFTSYPQVLGGIGDKTKVIPGVGVVGTGRGGNDLPSMQGLGATEQSQFFPFSRTPGDQELIPDPYRVAQMFDTSSLSSKTEPVPFLTDFSAFQK